MKKIYVILTCCLTVLILTACTSETKSSVYPDINNESLPNTLLKTVGTIGDCYYTSGNLTDSNDYQTYIKVTFNEITAEDFDTLVSYYKSTCIDQEEDGTYIFQWGWLNISTEDTSIFVEAYVK